MVLSVDRVYGGFPSACSPEQVSSDSVDADFADFSEIVVELSVSTSELFEISLSFFSAVDSVSYLLLMVDPFFSIDCSLPNSSYSYNFEISFSPGFPYAFVSSRIVESVCMNGELIKFVYLRSSESVCNSEN